MGSKPSPWALAALAAPACTPAIDPLWVLSTERELAMLVEVVGQGPYGRVLDPQAPSSNEALALDTIRATPLVVGPDGPIALGELNPRWFLCPSGFCLQGQALEQTEPCRLDKLSPDEVCTLPGGDSVEFTLGDFVAGDPGDDPGDDPGRDPDSLIAANRPPSLSFIASTASGPGTDACLANLEARESLSGCLLMERPLGLGSLAEVFESLAALGYAFEVSESLKPLLQVPRNHNPSVRALTVSIDGDSAVSHDSGSTVTVPRGSTVTVRYEPDEADIDRYIVELDGELLQVEDVLAGRFFASYEVADFAQGAEQRSVVWRAADDAPVTLYFVVADDRRAEAWGWLDFRIE